MDARWGRGLGGCLERAGPITLTRRFAATSSRFAGEVFGGKMIVQILRAARGLDETIKARLGRPYNVVLCIGLVLEIGRLIHELLSRPQESRGVVVLVVSMAFYGLLLIHQLGELSDHADRRRRGATA
ncbi:MAG TPA: hypothetical protein VMB73_27855 [Acetobacteraceae bacterium]|nr:hypothetical protein [Acetobacteraceae bacterium]